MRHKYIRRHYSKYQVRLEGKTVPFSDLDAAIAYRNKTLGYDPDPSFVVRKTSKVVSLQEFGDWWLDNPSYDPVFSSLVQEAKAKAEAGTLTGKDFDKLKKIIADSWVPWNDDEVAEQKAYSKAVKAAR
ncbi:hypothetical protein [Aestuariivita boseongensis]|uniref:hypothetical protein n=1 Tax=Aestuariivita boseongensis TaxID=1470562 RepID=UPI0006819AE3|nr:hypothetical protein [Aestuariivita boseongensis]